LSKYQETEVKQAPEGATEDKKKYIHTTQDYRKLQRYG
jgi:hypothetical protein